MTIKNLISGGQLPFAFDKSAVILNDFLDYLFRLPFIFIVLADFFKLMMIIVVNLPLGV